MRHAAIVAVALVAALGAAEPAEAQSRKLVDKKHACCTQGRPTAWPLYNQGVKWETSLDEAQARAREEHRPILLHVLVGDMDKEGT